MELGLVWVGRPAGKVEKPRHGRKTNHSDVRRRGKAQKTGAQKTKPPTVAPATSLAGAENVAKPNSQAGGDGRTGATKRRARRKEPPKRPGLAVEAGPNAGGAGNNGR